MIIGICGLIGSGKGTVADYLVSEHAYQKISFADKLKDAVATLFDWDRTLLEGDTPESRLWREEPDTFWTAETSKEITPRLVLQLFGTDCMRNGFYDGIWVSLLKQRVLANPTTNFVVPDVRFPNEINAIRDIGGKIIFVRRGELPTWWANAVKTNAAGKDGERIVFDSGDHMEVAYPEVHASEWSWARHTSEFDITINNNGTLNELHQLINLKLTQLEISNVSA